MKQIQKDGLIFHLISSLKKNGSWCGETHIQKAIYFIQEMMGVPLGFDYTIYKHGPFSFDLSDELRDLRADSLLEWEVRPEPYGNSLKLAPMSLEIVKKIPQTISRYGPAISFIAEEFGSKGVKDLEKISTALYVTMNPAENGSYSRAQRIHELKPHISVTEAESALNDIDEMMKKSRSITS
ncbi:hypothetical protein, partial [Methanocalculus sp.]|uniref:hypothetical protein n=1 Tax=Methanocalculus sp. TaxID=2004547 RepID=UPI002602ADE4